MTDGIVWRLLFVLLVDMVMDALSILMALRVMNVRIRPVRVFFGAFFGAAAALTLRGAMHSKQTAACLWLPLALCMMRISTGDTKGIRAAIRSVPALLSCMGFLGGTVLALSGATGSLEAAYLLSGLCAAAVFVGVMRGRAASLDVRRIQVECAIKGRRLLLDAVVDSGNSLRDYLTHRPVIVTACQNDKEMLDKARLIFADTAGGKQMMQLIIPQDTTLIVEGKRMPVQAALAFSPGLDEKAPALVPAALLRGEG